MPSNPEKIPRSVTIYPPLHSPLNDLAHDEADFLIEDSQNSKHDLIRRCVLAVMNSGSRSDDVKTLMRSFEDFDLKVVQGPRGIKLQARNAPGEAFTARTQIIEGVRQHIFAVLRDLVFEKLQVGPMGTSQQISDGIFKIVRHAGVLYQNSEIDHHERPRFVCWGGHSIPGDEYEYSKQVGYHLGIEGSEMITGSGAGIMKGPGKGALIAYKKQRIQDARFIGLSEPGIIVAEPPNAIIDPLIILPDIEKRLEAFVRLGHGILVFPGGAGTVEEIQYILGILMRPENAGLPFPLVFTGPREAEPYFDRIHSFIGNTLGPEAQKKYRLVIEDPKVVTEAMMDGFDEVKQYRRDNRERFNWNHSLHIPVGFQQPFKPTHENVAQLNLSKNADKHHLAEDLRRAFSAIVAGNVKPEGIQAIEQHGKFQIQADPEIMAEMDSLLRAFVEQGRMKVGQYEPCYDIIQRG